MGDVDNGGEPEEGSGQRVYGRLLYLPLNFAVNQKLLQKSSLNFLKVKKLKHDSGNARYREG